MRIKPLYISYYVHHKASENTLQFYGVCNIFQRGGSKENDTKKAKEIMTNISVEKATYLNTLEYEARQMKETDLHAASVRTELVKTKEEIKAIETAMKRLLTLKYAAQQGGKER